LVCPSDTQDQQWRVGQSTLIGRKAERVVLLARGDAASNGSREIIAALSYQCRKHDALQFSTLERAFGFWQGRNIRGVRRWDGRSVEICTSSNCHLWVFDPRPSRCRPVIIQSEMSDIRLAEKRDILQNANIEKTAFGQESSLIRVRKELWHHPGQQHFKVIP